VVSRAVTQLPKFVSWVSKKIKKGNSSGVGNGIIYIKGGDLKEELSKVSWKKEMYDISTHFNEEFFETKKVVHLVKR
jgi:16S rRNA (guanine527-N7)-methyltransferase